MTKFTPEEQDTMHDIVSMLESKMWEQYKHVATAAQSIMEQVERIERLNELAQAVKASLITVREVNKRQG